MTKTVRPKIVVLISGNGSNLQAIIDACAKGELQAEIAAVVSNKENVFGLERAKRANIPTIVKTKLSHQDRNQYDQELAEMISQYHPDWIVLAGWMYVLSMHFLKQFSHQVVNLHPALPREFPGTKAIERAFEAFQKGQIQKTGVMVHLVPDEGVDSGPVLGTEEVPIFPEDSLEDLSKRVHETEHRLLVEVLKKLIKN